VGTHQLFFNFLDTLCTFILYIYFYSAMMHTYNKSIYNLSSVNFKLQLFVITQIKINNACFKDVFILGLRVFGKSINIVVYCCIIINDCSYP